MTVAEKLTKIAKNEQKVYEAGYDSGYTEGINKGGYADGFEEGKKAEYDAFWDAFQNYGNRNTYNYAFFQWGADTVHPKYKVVPTDASSLNQTFCESKLKKIESAYFDFSQRPSGTYDANSAYFTCNACKELEEIEDIGLFDSFKYCATFSWSPKLHTIAKIRVAESTLFNGAFTGCAKLKNITIEGTIGQNGLDFSACKELSADNIINIIEHLSLTASGKTLTLSKAAVDKAFEESEGANNGSQTQDWEYWYGTKQTWTISLV